MGGNALQRYTAIRLNRDTYHSLAGDTIELLRSKYPRERFALTVSYSEKASFGDIDILTTVPDLVEAAKSLSPVEIVTSSKSVSVGIATSSGIAQVDLLKVDPESFNFAHSYYSFNDMGGLIGTVAKSRGLKLSPEGLFYRVEFNGEFIEDALITSRWDTALRILQFSVLGWHRGFRTPEEIYGFMVWSVGGYSDLQMFMPSSFAGEARRRNAARPMIVGFQQWLQTAYAEVLEIQGPRRRVNILEHIHAYVPSFRSTLEEYRIKYEKTLLFREKFNGKLFSEITGLTGKELGIAMRNMMAHFQDIESWVLEASEEDIRAEISRAV